MALPVTVTYTTETLPEWMAVVPEAPENPVSITITLETYDKLRIATTNIEGLLVDLQKAITDTGLSVADVYAIISFLRFSAPKLTLIIDGTGTDFYEVVLPPGLTAIDVRKATGESVPFFYNVARNSIAFTVTFASTETLEVFLGSIQNLLNRSLSAIVTAMVTIGVLGQVIKQLGEITREVRERIV
jgi:hypothetical protein